MAVAPGWLPTTAVAVVLAVVVSVGVVRWLDRRHDWGSTRRSRLLLGVPWGTVTVILFVLGVYLFVQGAWSHWRSPLVIPFRSWSYLYPLGMLTAAFSHAGVAHITGNLLGTATFGTLAEYAWGHFPTERGSGSFASWRTNPYVRAFVLFPAGAVLVGLVTVFFGWGPIIGFSGVVFAFVGFGLVRYPVWTVVALTVDDVLGVVYHALQSPVIESQAKPTFGQPWWAGIAVQGHLLGLFVGLLVGVLVLRRRDRNPTRLWVGSLLVATSLSLWALWWYRGNDHYVLYRGLGVVFVLALALVVTLGVVATQVDWTLPELNVPVKTLGLLLLLLPPLVVGLAAVPLNLTTVADAAPPGAGPALHARDYTIVYAENVTNRETSVVNLSFLGETTEVRTSGVIVVSAKRHLWTTAVSTSRLAFEGRVQVPVGGPGWRRTAVAARDGWHVAGNGTVYRVFLRLDRGPWHLAFRSPRRTADVVLAGDRVAIAPGVKGFVIDVRRDNATVASAPMPAANASVEAGGITFTRRNDRLVASVNGTRVPIAERERYRGA